MFKGKIADRNTHMAFDKIIRRSLCAGVGLIFLSSASGQDVPSVGQTRSAAPDGFVAVRERVTPSERKELQRFCVEKLALERVQMSRPAWIATNAYARLADVPFKTLDGVANRLTVVSSRRGMRLLRWTAEGAAAKPGAAGSDALSLVMSVVFPGGVGKSHLMSAGRLLSRSSAVIRRRMTKSPLEIPYDEFYFFMADDMPGADWMHPARYVFLKSDLTAWTVLFEKEPVAVESAGAPVKLVPAVKSQKSLSSGQMTRTEGAARRLLSESTPSAIVPLEGGNPSRCHALLVLGGADVDNNHRRYWNELSYVYNMMRKRFGLPRENIKVLWANGDPSRDMCHNGICTSTEDGDPCKRYVFVDDDLCDFDKDGNDDITATATRANLKSAFDGYAATLTAEDQLLVFFSDHGGTYGNEEDPSEPAVIWLWEECVKDTELAAWTQGIRCPVMYALKTCFSGGMIAETVASSRNRVVATADAYDPSMACVFVGYWTYYFFGALGGYYPAPYRDGGECSPYSAMNPRLAGDACTGADLDGDGRVSFQEAHLFACKMNPCTKSNGRTGQFIDTPQYQESTVGLGKKLFMVKYEDSQPIVVREQVAVPAFETESDQFAPYLVQVSCATPGATIRYTLDGSEPTETSAVSRGGIEITADVTVTVRAFKSNMDGSAPASRRYTVRKTAPEAAKIVSVSQADSSTGIVVEWLAGAGAENYEVLRAETESMRDAVGLANGLAPDVLAYADMTAVPGRSYYYQVRAVNAYGRTASAVSQGAALALNAPTGVAATLSGSAGLSSASVRVSWQSVKGATHYRVSRKGADGRLVDLGDWTSGTSYTDSVTYAHGGGSFTYYVRAAVDANGGHAGAPSEGAEIAVVYDLAGASLEICLEPRSEVGVDAVAVKADGTTTCYCRLRNADGSLDGKDFLSGLTWQVVSGDGLTLRQRDGSYSTNPASLIFGDAYTPPSVNIIHGQGLGDCTVKVTYSVGGKSVSRELRVVKTDQDVIKTLTINSPPFAVPGEVRELWADCTLYGSSSWRDDVPEGTEIKWSVIGDGGATVSEDGELTAWPVAERKTVIVQAKVDTLLGPVTARQTVSVSPSVVQKMQAVIPPTGGESTNYVGAIDSVTYGEWENADWINGVTYYGSNSEDPKDISVRVSLGKGRNQVSIGNKLLFFSFRADRNAEKDREALFKLRWDGGGVDFTILQQQAPTAEKPEVRIDPDGGLQASAPTAGAAVRYALDGEEPSESSPLLDGKLLFDCDTAVAAKSFGEWMQASETVYETAPGRADVEEEVSVCLTFDPVESGVAAPEQRVCKVSEKFGELPELQKDGLYFKGWTLDVGSGKCVRSTDYVPRQNTTLYAVWSKVKDDEPVWTALPWNFKSSMRASVVVVDKATGEKLNPSVCSVGVEDASSVCRGSTKNGFGDTISSENGKDGKHVFGVYGQVGAGTEAGLVVRVWHPDFGFIKVLNPALTFTAGGALGSDESPYVIEVELTPARSGACSISIAKAGWCEVSFSVLPEGASPEEVFADVLDKIGYVAYSSKNWNPQTGGTLTALEIGKGYWVQTTAANVSWTVTGQGDPGVEIALKAGWNLIGYPLFEEGEVETVLATALATEKIDYISSGSRVYPGTLTTLAPGKGYWVYANAAVTIKFDFD